MKQFLIIIFSVAFSSMLFAQDDINLLDMIKDDSIVMEQSNQLADNQGDAWDWTQHRHSLNISMGAPSLFHMGLSGFKWLLQMGNEDFDQFSGAFGIEYDYNVKRWLRVGARFTYQYISDEWHYPEEHFITTTARLDFTYMNKRKVRLYSGLEAGIAMIYSHYDSSPDSDEMRPGIDLALVPFGLQAGGEHVFFLGELSVGTAEFCRIGLGYRF